MFRLIGETDQDNGTINTELKWLACNYTHNMCYNNYVRMGKSKKEQNI